MSYCRFSDDDYQCDVFCFSHYGDFFVINVAKKRYVFAEPLPDKVPYSETEKWFERHSTILRLTSSADKKKIGLPFDGMTFTFETAKETADKLTELKEIGYNVPQYAIDTLIEEANENPIL